jgi:starch-binding outer membrane protein, SusD/RagB family
MKRISFILLFATLGITACEKAIDLYPQSNLNTATFYSNTNEINIALVGCYNGLQKVMNDEWTLTELRSDNVVQGNAASTSTVNRDLSDLDMFFPNTSHAGLYNYWINSYYNIRNINLVLNSLEVNYNPSSGTISYDKLSLEVSEADRKKIAAQACFLRAHHYFNMVRLYGGVFLVHEPLAPIDAKTINRSSVDDIYKLIVADLQSAAANGAAQKFAQIPAADLGRVNSWSAKALLAKVYLTLNRKADAIPVLQDVISNSGYSLQSNYANIFSITSEMNSEILFSVRYKAGGLGIGSPFGNLFAPLNSGSAVINGDGSGLCYPAVEISNQYTAADLRKPVNIGVYGTGSSTRLYPKKHINTQTVVRDGETDWPLLRFADVLLMMAEAQGNSSSSVSQINLIRQRAGLTALNPADISSVELFENALATERKLEFAFENQRWFDMLRFNTTLTTIKAEKTLKDHFAVMYPLHYISYPSPRLTLAELQAKVTAEKLLLPIPQREIDNNTQLTIAQNPGY